MVIIKNESTDPYFNLACEQYLLDNFDGDIFMLWINSPVCVIGKSQNAYGELNTDFIKENNIKVVRRLTGGGAVFHDTGNLNYTFIVPEKGNKALDFEKFTKPIISALESLGIENVALSGRNDIMIGNKKVSGNAQCVYNGKIMHHGTLLFSADMSNLAGALRVDEEKIKSKGIKSVRQRVGNISDYIDSEMTCTEFKNYLESYISDNFKTTLYTLSGNDIEKIQTLSGEKYSTWEWNFGKSKHFEYTNKKRFPFGGVEIKISSNGGVITDCEIAGDFFGVKDISELSRQLIGIKFDKKTVVSTLKNKNIILSDYISGMNYELFECLI